MKRTRDVFSCGIAKTLTHDLTGEFGGIFNMRAYDRQWFRLGAAWAGHSYVVGVVVLELISTASHYMR